MKKQKGLVVAALCATLGAGGFIGCGDGAVEEKGDFDVQVPVTSALPSEFDITNYGKLLGVPYIKVRGRAGGSRAQVGSNEILAYVFVTDAGTYAITSHSFKDSIEQRREGDTSYHGHMVTLDNTSCVSSINDKSFPYFTLQRVFLLGAWVKRIDAVLTARLTVTDRGVCVDKVYDQQPVGS